MKKFLTIIIFLLFLLVTVNAYEYGSYIYDEINDSSINNSLWSQNIVSNTTVVYWFENTDYMEQITNTSTGTYNIDLNATNLIDYSIMNNLTFRLGLWASFTGSGSGTDCGRSYLIVFGTLIKTVERCSTTGTTSDDSVYTVLANASLGSGWFTAYDDGVLLSSFAATDSILSNRIYGVGNLAKSYGAFYYVYEEGNRTGINYKEVTPSDGYYQLTNKTIDFFVNITSYETMVNVSLYLNGVLNETQSLTGNINDTTFTKTLSDGVYNYSFVTCDSGDLVECKSSGNRTITLADYEILSSSAPETGIVGGPISFSYLVNISDSVSITEADLVYNGTSYEMYVSNIYDNVHNITLDTTATLPEGVKDYYLNMTLSTGEIVQSDTGQVTISVIGIDNCTAYSYSIINLTLFDERTKDAINGTIEVFFTVLNSNYDEISTLNFSQDEVYYSGVCSFANLTSQNLYYSAEIRYYSSDYVTELYHLQRVDIATVSSIDLFLLNSSSSTEFKITYQDSTFNFVEGAIIQLQRKYISEGIYEVVEAPLTSSEGISKLHIDLDSVKYRVTVVKNGEVLDTFDNVVFKCQSVLTGECEQKLLGQIDPGNEQDYDIFRDFAYTDPVLSNGTTTVSFTVPSGVPAEINIVLQQKDSYGNTTLCNKTITSSAGQVSCDYSITLGDSYIEYSIYKNGVPIAKKTYLINSSKGLDWLDNNFILILVLLFSLVGMALSSPEWIIMNGILTMVLSGRLFLANGLDFVTGLGSIAWLVIAAVIYISKLSKQEDR